jgi:hypothetical protein
MSKRPDLLNVRICDLGLNLETSPLYSRVLALYEELSSRRLCFRPPCYFADEWFVPDGDPVIGIPFYLANERLRRLERQEIGEVEGDTKPYFMKLLRHEAGHAISHAFKLHRRRIYRTVFGSSAKPFSDIYHFDPKSTDYVINLNDHYAQSHPDEDFAETFAVWLALPERVWRNQYKGSKALKKLLTVARMMKELERAAPPVRTGEKMCRTSTLKYTLKTFYKRRRLLPAHNSGVRDK